MKTEWKADGYNGIDHDLWVYCPDISPMVKGHGSTGWVVLAFVRSLDGLHVCRFAPMSDDEFPDGKTYKTRRSAKRWCEKHAPAMWMLFRNQLIQEKT